MYSEHWQQVGRLHLNSPKPWAAAIKVLLQCRDGKSRPLEGQWKIPITCLSYSVLSVRMVFWKQLWLSSSKSCWEPNKKTAGVITRMSGLLFYSCHDQLNNKKKRVQRVWRRPQFRPCTFIGGTHICNERVWLKFTKIDNLQKVIYKRWSVAKM